MSYIFFILLILFVLLIFISFTGKKKVCENSSLEKNGYVLLDMFNENDLNYINELWKNKETDKIKHCIHNHANVQKQIKNQIGNDYVFQDYVLLIEKSRIHTCHRDFNSPILNKNQKYTSYTIIFYMEPMENCLDVIDGSHKHTGIYLTDSTCTVKCKVGQALLFDASLFHVGSFNDKPDNKRIQMKLSHYDDIDNIKIYEQYNKTLNKDTKIPQSVVAFQKHMSCQLPVMADLTTTAKNAETESTFSSMFSQVFYGDSNFYTLDNV